MDLMALITKKLCEAAATYEGVDSPYDTAMTVVTKHLPELIEALELGLVTEHEVAQGITGRFVLWLRRYSGQESSGTTPVWDALVDEIEAILCAH